MSLSQFKSQFGGGARSNLFRAYVFFPGSLGFETVPLMAKTAKLPASSINQIEVAYRGRKLKVAGERTFEEDYTLTFYNDRSFNLRDQFETWSNLINSHTTNYSAYDGESGKDAIGNDGSLGYMGSVTIEQLDKSLTPAAASQGAQTSTELLAAYQFVDAWPKTIGEIELSYDDDTIETFDVTFAYQYWTRLYRTITTN